MNVYSRDHGNGILIKSVAFNNNEILNSYSEDVDNNSYCEDNNGETVVDFEVGTREIISDELKGCYNRNISALYGQLSSR